MAACYRPADELTGLGGDWYDLIPLSGARVALVVGEVPGHGIDAAAAMGQLRTAVRTLDRSGSAARGGAGAPRRPGGAVGAGGGRRDGRGGRRERADVRGLRVPVRRLRPGRRRGARWPPRAIPHRPWCARPHGHVRRSPAGAAARRGRPAVRGGRAGAGGGQHARPAHRRAAGPGRDLGRRRRPGTAAQGAGADGPARVVLPDRGRRAGPGPPVRRRGPADGPDEASRRRAGRGLGPALRPGRRSPTPAARPPGSWRTGAWRSWPSPRNWW